MKKLIISLLVMVSMGAVSANLTAAPAASLPKPIQSTQQLNRVIATVNSEPITQHQFDVFYQRSLDRLKASHQKVPTDLQGFRTYLLNQYVLRVIQLQLAKNFGITVTDKQVNQQIKSILKQQKLTLPQLQQKLQLEGYSFSEFKKEVKTEVTVGALQRRAVGSDIQVTQQQIATELAKLKAAPQFAKQYHVVDILTPLKENPSKAALARALATSKEMKAHLLKGASYKYISDDNDTDLGWRTLAAMPDVFASAVGKLKVGGVAGPIRAANGYHVLKLLRTKNAKAAMPTKDAVAQRLYMMKLQKGLSKWQKTLLKQANVTILHPV
ncbi:MAG: hypothetical protein COB66_09150 [Coxiella sp. (in: Bacteria)]|nr:MAG: hypothetical protein COB66_09150 [Coxiella sp. (in: g-proteobacteria)]